MGVFAGCPRLARTGHASFLVLPDLSSMTLYPRSGLLRDPAETPPCSVQLNFAQNGVPTGLRARNHSLNALEFVEIGAESLGRDCVHGEASRREELIDPLDGRFIACSPGSGEIDPLRIGFHERFQNFLQSLIRRGRHQTRQVATVAQHIPFVVDEVSGPNLLKNVGWLHGAVGSGRQLLIGGCILPLEKGWRAKPCQSSPPPPKAGWCVLCGVWVPRGPKRPLTLPQRHPLPT